jgi:hypothetical protein
MVSWRSWRTRAQTLPILYCFPLSNQYSAETRHYCHEHCQLLFLVLSSPKSLLVDSLFQWILGHSVARDASLHKDAEDKVDMQGDLTLTSVIAGEDAAFLNSGSIENI